MTPNLLAVISLSIACGLLSVLVVARRWSFIGEGISHSGFGGAGTAWVLALVFPAMDDGVAVFAGVTVFCLLTAVAIGAITSGPAVDGDAAIGIFMVASLAWGFLAREIYRAHCHVEPVGFEELLFGRMSDPSKSFVVSTIALSTAVVFALYAFRHELVAYCFDPVLARASGVRTALVHFVLLLLVTLVIVLGIQVAGSVLVTALLVLPGATGGLLGRRLSAVFGWSITTAALAAAGGVVVHSHWRVAPIGPAIVLCQFGVFLSAFVASRFARTRFSTE